MDGVKNYLHTPYLVDLVSQGSIIIPDLWINVTERFIHPEIREHLYVPGSTKATLGIVGGFNNLFSVKYLSIECLCVYSFILSDINIHTFRHALFSPRIVC